MRLHWESSKKPLFIKTVWKDGQRHVLLNKQQIIKENVHLVRRQNKNLTTAKPFDEISNIRISSFKLLKSTDFCNLTDKMIRCKTSLPRPKFRAILEKDLKNSGMKKEEERKMKDQKSNFLIKSYSMDLSKESYFCHSYSDVYEYCPLISNNIEFNTISQRLLVWLDLALQNYDWHNKPKKITNEATRMNYNETKVQLMKNRVSDSVHLEEKKRNIDITNMFHVSSISEVTETAKPLLSQIILPSAKSDSFENKTDKLYQPLVSSSQENTEENFQIPDEMMTNKYVNFKQQIHIFMPALKEKINDCESSILSSTYSLDLVMK